MRLPDNSELYEAAAKRAYELHRSWTKQPHVKWEELDVFERIAWRQVAYGIIRDFDLLGASTEGTPSES